MSTASIILGLNWAKYKEKIERVIKYFQSKQATSIQTSILEKDLIISLLAIEELTLEKLDKFPFILKTPDKKRYLDNTLLHNYRMNDYLLTIYMVLGLIILVIFLKYLFS